jgi:hypothetical protein
MLIGTEPYSVVAMLGLSDQEGLAEARDEYRRELVLHVSETLTRSGEDTDVLKWSVVDQRPEHGLGLSLVSSDPQRGVAAAQRLMRSYLDRLDRIARARASNLSAGHVALLDSAARLQAQIANATSAAPLAPDHQNAGRKSGGDSGPAPGSPEARQELMRRMDAWRVAVTYLQDELHSAEARQHELVSSPAPQRASVPAEQRAAALAADVSLTQDLAELTVKLTELRASLLTVWQSAAARIDELTTAATHFSQAGRVDGAAQVISVDRIVDHAEECRRLIEAFAGAWNREFAAMRQEAVDPVGPSVVEGLERCMRLRNDLLFNVSSVLTAVRNELHGLEQGGQSGGFTGAEQARQHRITSALLSGFHALEKAHERFEFATAGVQPENNPRVDAALRAAQGLRRRTQARIQQIDEQLAGQALNAARQARVDAGRRLEQHIGQLREELSRRIDEGLTLQADWLAERAAADEWVRSTASAEERRLRVAETQKVLGTIESHVKEVAAAEAGGLDPAAVKPLGCTVQRLPIDLAGRIARGWLVASAMLVMVVFVPRLVRGLLRRQASHKVSRCEPPTIVVERGA